MLSHKSFIILALTFDSIWVNFHIFYEVGIPFHSFAHDYLIPEALVENTILSPFNFLNTLVKNHVSVLSHFSRTQFCATLQSVVHQTPLSMGFSKQEYWSSLPCPPPGDLLDPGIKPASLVSPARAGEFFTNSATWEVPWQDTKQKMEAPWFPFQSLFHETLSH